MSNFGHNPKIDTYRGWRRINKTGPVAAQKILNEKADFAENKQLADLLRKCFSAVLRAYCEDGGVSALEMVSSEITDFDWYRLGERKTALGLGRSMGLSVLEKWESDIINAFSIFDESRLAILYRKNGETVIRIVVDNIDTDLLHEYNKVYVQEELRLNAEKRVDFLIIDKNMYENSHFPERTFIKTYSE
jgi:hypothetical protein